MFEHLTEARAHLKELLDQERLLLFDEIQQLERVRAAAGNDARLADISRAVYTDIEKLQQIGATLGPIIDTWRTALFARHKQDMGKGPLKWGMILVDVERENAERKKYELQSIDAAKRFVQLMTGPDDAQVEAEAKKFIRCVQLWNDALVRLSQVLEVQDRLVRETGLTKNPPMPAPTQDAHELLAGSVAEKQRFLDARSRKVLSQVSLAHADLRELRFVRWTFDAVSFRNTQCENIVFKDCTFTNCGLQGAVCTRAVMDGCQFVHCDLSGARFPRASLTDWDVRGCELRQTSFPGTRFSGKTVWDGADLFGASFTRCDLNDMAFPFTHLDQVQFIGCSLRRANFNDADLLDAQFADFDRSKESRSDLSGAQFARAKNVFEYNFRRAANFHLANTKPTFIEPRRSPFPSF